MPKLVERRADELATAATALRDAWSGRAAGAAFARLGGLRADLLCPRPALIEADQVLAEFAGRIAGAKARLDSAVAHADRSGVQVDRRGQASADPTRARTPGSAQAVAAVAGEIGAALDAARAADREAAGRLGELVGAAGTGWASPPPPGRPASGAAPAAVRQWWVGLTPAQRRWLVTYEPDRVGRLDGVPVAARDQANRLLLAQHRADLLTERRRLLGRMPSGPVELVGLRRVDAALAGLDALAIRLAAPEGPRAYLLGLATREEGRAVVALGNPDRSGQVLTYVPGMGAGLDDVAGELDRAGRVLSRCTALAPGEETSTVLWLDYDAPDFLHEAAWPRQADDAGPALHRFQEGLRATHEGDGARQTVLGHSYGSLVVGISARDHGLAADALVFLGSPGVGVDHARDLGLPSGQVWASTATDDVIRLACPPEELFRRALLVAGPLGAAVTLLDGPDRELWFGRDPSDPRFGGRTFPSGRYGHTGYWHPDNPALDGLARVVLGR
ncbi:alpha/beta hydrolase [Micromonospora sp. WMMA1363]|uniref:alpha/beta hydrolase n=1 Tax=Micromonospora sp. WMMA1363 TaxID=3053985 RepID=UPI00259C7BE7|nr:alpha/beta hydrolase [Micromonospora sp. WMMA1363]MDM4720765.1 alpha/beta hydrolase [Micromonospora sp. WMMA1363]